MAPPAFGTLLSKTVRSRSSAPHRRASLHLSRHQGRHRLNDRFDGSTGAGLAFARLSRDGIDEFLFIHICAPLIKRRRIADGTLPYRTCATKGNP
jgi:hypothetical protein